MSGIHFSARKWAGSFPLTLLDGTEKLVHVRVMDKALYDEFREQEEAMQKQVSDFDNLDTYNKARVGAMSTEMAYVQLLKLCPELTEGDLEGFDLMTIREMFQYATKVAYGLERSDEEKKNRSNTGSKRSGRRKQGQASSTSQAG